MTEVKHSRLDLHTALQRQSFNHGVICTYSFNPSFFENYCLEKLDSLNNNGNISVIVDHETYEKAILAPESHRPKLANLRYLLFPISVAGVFHPKLFLFASKNRGRLFIGSANFTRPGITSNAETVGCYDFELGKNETLKGLFQEAFAFLLYLCKKWPNETLSSNLQEMLREAQWLNPEESSPLLSNVKFMHNLETPLWEQISSGLEAPVDTIYILSRYFDASPSILDKLYEELHPKKVKLYTQNGITTMTEDWLDHPLVKGNNVEIYLCEYEDEGYSQPLHAKLIAIEKSGKCYLAFGSSNFTSSGLLKTADMGNVEVMLFLGELNPQIVNIERLLDPANCAARLQDKEVLKSSPGEDLRSPDPKHDITVLEAILDDDRIRVTANIPDNYLGLELLANLTFQDEARKPLQLIHSQGEKYSANVSEDITRRLGTSSSILQILAKKGSEIIASSNFILITNLLDIQSGQSVRRERYVKEARQSAVHFFQVLKGLIEGDDTEALRVFLNFCEIPVTDAPRPVFVRRARPTLDSQGMRTFGERNLVMFTDLHDLVLHFYGRHYKKLQHHIDYGNLNGIANFLHIFLAMGGVLCTQTDRLVQGLQSKTGPLSPNEWYTYRKNLDVYFGRFRKLMGCLTKDYLPKMTKDYDLDKIRERFVPDFPTLRDLFSSIVSVREIIEPLRSSKLKVMTTQGQSIIPQYFRNNIFSEKQWPTYEKELIKMFLELESTIIE